MKLHQVQVKHKDLIQLEDLKCNCGLSTSFMISALPFTPFLCRKKGYLTSCETRPCQIQSIKEGRGTGNFEVSRHVSKQIAITQKTINQVKVYIKGVKVYIF